MNSSLLKKDVQEFIRNHYKEDLSKIIFSGSPFPEVDIQELAVQLAGRLKAEKKLPTWFSTEAIIFPPGLNLEQTSSEKTAEYKAGLISGKTLADLTGGFGIDAHYFSKRFQRVVHCELDPHLSEIAAHNSEILGDQNIAFFNGNGLDFLNSSEEKFEWLYLDPARRDESGGKIFRISEMTPDISKHFDLLWKKADNILVKTSPLLDLQMGINELQDVREIHIVAVDNEVKEILWILRKQKVSEEIIVKTLNFKKNGIQEYSNFFGRSFSAECGLPDAFLYEPNVSIMKSGFFDAVSLDFDLKKLHQNTHLYTCEKLIQFPGRRFEILKILPFKKKQLRKEMDFSRAHIATRNFPISVKELRNVLKLGDGGEKYLFFTTTSGEEKIVLICKKITP